VAKAKVEHCHQATGVVREGNSDAQGFYTFATCRRATTKFASRVLFAEAETKDVRLEVGRTSTVDVKLTVAKAGEIVTVQIQEAQSI